MTQHDASGGGHRLADVDSTSRARLIRRSLARGLLTAVSVVTIYFLIPFSWDTSRSFVVRTTLGVIAVTVVTVAVLRSILRADYPELRAVEGFSLALPLLLAVFGGVYLSLSVNQTDAFTEPLDHVGALYLSLMTASTVGFGDIAPQTQWARVLVMVQMVANVILLGVATRLAYSAIRANLSGRSG